MVNPESASPRRCVVTPLEPPDRPAAVRVLSLGRKSSPVWRGGRTDRRRTTPQGPVRVPPRRAAGPLVPPTRSRGSVSALLSRLVRRCNTPLAEAVPVSPVGDDSRTRGRRCWRAVDYHRGRRLKSSIHAWMAAGSPLSRRALPASDHRDERVVHGSARDPQAGRSAGTSRGRVNEGAACPPMSRGASSGP